MPRVIIQKFSTFYDIKTRTQFDPVLDKRTGCFVAVAEVTEEEAAEFAERAAFTVLDDAEYLAMTSSPRRPEPTEPATGDPLTDAGAASLLSAPKLPKSK